MDFIEYAPITHEEYLLFESTLVQSVSFDEAKKRLPEKLLKAVETLMSEKNITYEMAVYDIKKYLSSLKTIKIYLAFEPSRKFREKIVDLLNRDFKNFVIEFVIDRSLIGGAKMAVDGKYFDKSLTSLIR